MKDHSVYVEEPDVVELKACPFCGSADVELRESLTDAAVACNNCGCRTGLVQLGRDDAAAAFSKREVVAVWNTRASTPPVTVDDVEVAKAIYFAMNPHMEPSGEVWLNTENNPFLLQERCRWDNGEIVAYGREAYLAAAAALEAIRNRKGDDRG